MFKVFSCFVGFQRIFRQIVNASLSRGLRETINELGTYLSCDLNWTALLVSLVILPKYHRSYIENEWILQTKNIWCKVFVSILDWSFLPILLHKCLRFGMNIYSTFNVTVSCDCNFIIFTRLVYIIWKLILWF